MVWQYIGCNRSYIGCDWCGISHIIVVSVSVSVDSSRCWVIEVSVTVVVNSWSSCISVVSVAVVVFSWIVEVSVSVGI